MVSDASHPPAEKEWGYSSYSPCPHLHGLCLQTRKTWGCVQPAHLPRAQTRRHGSFPAAPTGAGSLLLQDLNTANGACGCGEVGRPWRGLSQFENQQDFTPDEFRRDTGCKGMMFVLSFSAITYALNSSYQCLWRALQTP